jgi:hypothetical protein
MCEIVDQSNDDIELMKLNDKKNLKLIRSSLKTKFKQLKSLSDFLLILVKDLNYFSEHSLEKNIIIEEKETELKEIITITENITNSLLNKSNKSRFIKFLVDIHTSVPQKINTDEWRLKQILVNLLSNAVKFTLSGQIKLKLFVEKEIPCKTAYLKFQVIDTGVGINQEDQKKLFTPFHKGTHSNNKMGSGLGLFIANEISCKLGTGLNFFSSTSNGSSFSFGIPLAKDLEIEEFPCEDQDICNESKITHKIENFFICKNSIGLDDIRRIHSRYSSNSEDNKDLEISQSQISISDIKQDSFMTSKIKNSGMDVVKDDHLLREKTSNYKEKDINENLTVKEFVIDTFSDNYKLVLK